jgi:hypothetical protein
MPGSLKRPPEGLHEAGVLVADDELHAAQPALLQRGEEPSPERLVLAVADVEAEDFPRPVGGDARGHDDGHRHDLMGGVADVEVGRVEVDVGELDVPERAGAERADDLVQAGADPRHLGLRDPRLDAHGLDQVIDATAGDAVDVSLHHHRTEGLVDAAARFEDRGKERTLPQLRDPQLHIAGLRRQHPWAGAVALGGARVGALVTGCADLAGRLELDQLLHHHAGGVTDQVDAVASAERVEQFGQGRLG